MYGFALTRSQGDQEIIIPSRIVDVLIQVALSRATAIFLRLGCALCPRGLPWAKGWQITLIMSSSTVVLLLIILPRVFFPFSDLALHLTGLPRFGGKSRCSRVLCPCQCYDFPERSVLSTLGINFWVYCGAFCHCLEGEFRFDTPLTNEHVLRHRPRLRYLR